MRDLCHQYLQEQYKQSNSTICYLQTVDNCAKGIGVVRQQVVFSTLVCVCEYKGSFAQCYHL